MIRWGTKSLRNSTIIVILGLLSPLILDAQRFSYEYWHEGTLTLIDGKVLSGQIKYDFFNELIQFQSERGQNEAFTSKSVLTFEIKDKLQKVNRKFYCLPFHPEAGYESLRLFEVLVEGKMNLLVREEKEVRRQNYSYGVYVTPGQKDLIHSYYILKQGEKIKLFGGKKSELLNMMGAYAGNVQKYMKKNRLSVGNRSEFAQIISYYNSISK